MASSAATSPRRLSDPYCSSVRLRLGFDWHRADHDDVARAGKRAARPEKHTGIYVAAARPTSRKTPTRSRGGETPPRSEAARLLGRSVRVSNWRCRTASLTPSFVFTAQAAGASCSRAERRTSMARRYSSRNVELRARAPLGNAVTLRRRRSTRAEEVRGALGFGDARAESRCTLEAVTHLPSRQRGTTRNASDMIPYLKKYCYALTRGRRDFESCSRSKVRAKTLRASRSPPVIYAHVRVPRPGALFVRASARWNPVPVSIVRPRQDDHVRRRLNRATSSHR